MITTIEYEGEKIKVFAIVDKTVMEYFWFTSLELSRPGIRRVALSATDPHVNSMERLIKHWNYFGVEIIEKSRCRRKLINPKRNSSIEVNFAIIQRSPLLES